MSTPNFETQKDFNLYCYDEWDISDEEVKDLREANDYDSSISDDTLRGWIAEYNCEDVTENFSYALKECAEELNRKLDFYEIELRGGYYGGIQFYVKLADKGFSPYSNTLSEIFEWVDNEDTRYYYDMCLSEFKRKIKSEVNFINKKLLPLLARKTGFEQYSCIGIFSNGEAIYEKVS